MRLITAGFLLTVFVFSGVAASAQTADEIAEKAVAAIGGRAALVKNTSRSVVGKMSVATENGDIAGTFEAVNQAPNKMRRLITLDLSQFGMGTATIEQRFDGTTGQVLDSMRGNSVLSGAQLELLKNSVFPTPLLDYKERGTKLAVVGKEKVAERDVHVLTLTPAAGPEVRLFVDAQSYLVVRSVVTLDVPEAGPQQQTSDFSDYRDVGGIKVPFVIRGTSPIQTFTITLTKVEQNPAIDPALFVKPAAK